MNRPRRQIQRAGWLAAVGAIVCTATAQGETPQLGGPMKHIFVTLHEPTKALYHFIQDGADERVLLYDYGDTYTGDAAVLSGMHYSGRYGWLADGAWSVPPQRGIFVAVEEQPAELEVYEENTFTPLFGTAGSAGVWQWNTTMVHNWYSTSACGSFEARYKVYVGDLTGAEDTSYAPTYVTLKWHYVYADFEPGGDADGDGDADLADFALFQVCRTAGPAVPPSVCGCFDFDMDEDVDLADYDVFAGEQTTPGPGS